MKRVLKYGTGQEVPEGAVYLTTVVEEYIGRNLAGETGTQRLVWHYFAVSLEDGKK